MKRIPLLLTLLAAPTLAQQLPQGAARQDATPRRFVAAPQQIDTDPWHQDFALSVVECWVIDPGTEAARITVDIAFSFNPDGTVVTNSLKMVRASAGSEDAIKTAYESARRAILRCGAKGYDLPPEKYGQWKDVEISFNPEKMRMK